MNTGDDRRVTTLTLAWVIVEVSKSSVGQMLGTKVLEGVLRVASGRRIGDVDAPFGGMLVPADWDRGGACEPVERVDTAEFRFLDDLLSGMLNKACGLPPPTFCLIPLVQEGHEAQDSRSI